MKIKTCRGHSLGFARDKLGRACAGWKPAIQTILAGLLILPAAAASAIPPRLHVDGNKIKDPNDNVVILRGVSMIDLGAQDQWYGGAIALIDRITDTNDDTGASPGWYTKIIRIPVCPRDSALFAWSPLTFDPNDPNAAGNDTFYALLRSVVDYCGEKDVYAIIDWHHMANTYNELADTNVFWEYIAPRFADDTHVFFELFNEPMNSGGTEAQRWESVRADMQTWVDIIRPYAPNNLILVGAPSYDQILAPAVDNPIADANVVYVCHLYPSHWFGVYSVPQSWYTNHIITCAAVYPVICTEWGFRSGASTFFDGRVDDFGRPFKDFLEQYGISFTAWVASYTWESYMYYSGWTGLRCGNGGMGCFTKDWLYEKNGPAQELPATAGKCRVKAGKIQRLDNVDVSGTFGATVAVLSSVTELEVNIVSLNDPNNEQLVYVEQLDFTASSIVDSRFGYSYKIPTGGSGAITSLKLDLADKTFSLKAKNIDLTGLGAPLRLDLGIGNSIISSEVNEAIINGSRKSIPTRLMRTYQDTLVVTKAKVKQGSSPFTDSLSIKGDIALADINDYEPNLVNYDVNVVWGDQTFTAPAGGLTAKTGHRYKCSKIASDGNDGLITAKFDLNKCTFTVSVKEANALDAWTDDEIPFGISLADFNEIADVNLILGH